jgi:hypothetical protein
MTNSDPSSSPLTPPQRRHHSRRLVILSFFAAVVVSIPIISTNPGPGSIVLAQHGDRDHCEKVYVKMLGSDCIGGRYVVTWENRCADCGGLCDTWTSDEGPC